MEHVHLPHDHHSACEELLHAAPDVEAFQEAAETLKILSDASRIRIFWILCHCEECLINLAAMVDMSSPAVSHHLKIMKAAHLITSRREGKEMYYKAAETEQAHLLHKTIEQMIQLKCPGSMEEHED